MPVGGWDGLDETEIKALATELMRVASRIAAHQAAATRVLDESGLAKRSGASSTGALLAGEFGGDRAAGDRMVRTGQLMSRADTVQQALADGTVTERQAKTIATAVDTLGDDVSPQVRTQCQERLIADSQNLTAKDLQRRAQRVTDVFKESKAEVDADENTRLVERERRAWQRASFRIWDNGDGTHSGDFTIPEAQADQLRSTVEAMAAPRREHLQDQPLPVEGTGSDRMGRGFAQVCDKLTPETVMKGGPTLVVTVDEATLREHVDAPATLETGTRISAGEARRLACDTGIMPAVMGGKPVTLDLGRQLRRFNRNQRIAMGLRDRGCAFPGCDRPPQWCEAHHWRTAWADGGTTDLDDGVLLCGHHHRIVHHQGWSLRRADDGIMEFRPPGKSDWRRNHRWRAAA